MSDKTTKEQQYPNKIYLIPLRNSVFFPKIQTKIYVGREKSSKTITLASGADNIIGVVSQKNELIENPTEKDLYQYGTLAQIIKINKSIDSHISDIEIKGLKRFKIKKIINEEPVFLAEVEYLEDELPNENDIEIKKILENTKQEIQIIADINTEFIVEIVETDKIQDPELFFNTIASKFSFPIKTKIEALKINTLKKRALKIYEELKFQRQKLEVLDKINNKVHESIDKSQKEFILNQHLREIQKELGNDPLQKEIDELKEKAQKKRWNAKVKETFEKELSRLQRINHMSPEYGVQLSYLNTILDLPWDYKTEDNYDLKRAKEILDQDHFGLEKVKERILEYLAVLKLKQDLKSPIICLYGPPGVGKTSLGKSIAKALNRKYVRMSLGGLHDEAEIRGHRRTYIGAMPGRIIQSLKKAKSSNPVFVLDEIDKISADFHGDPAAALLEVLDPEQNNTFYDNYLEIEYDLSNVLFIATANTLSTISPALLDRMEIIQMTGYLLEEKIEIAKKHLIPKQLEAHGVEKTQCKCSDTSLKFLIENYTRESGVRQLDKQIASLIRKRAKEIAYGEKFKPTLTKEKIKKFLGAPKYTKASYEDCNKAGVITGLAWTATGGEILTIEASASRGSGKLTMTGNLGKVMSESATLSYEYIKAHYKNLHIHPLTFKFWDIHIHIPEGAIPKDGPSAGITITTALASLFTQRKTKPFLAMTGEITLTGRVLPVGGIKEKILAAKRAGIKEIILPEKNKADINEIKKEYIEGLKFHFVKNMSEVLKIALLNEKVKSPLKIGIPKNIAEKLKKINS